MTLPEKLRELRSARGMTQEAVAEYLGVSGQTVSKWERGLLSPDIRLLPRLAVLYETSLDALFDMNTLRADASCDCFWQHIHDLRAVGDNEGVYRTFLNQIELVPDHFDIYPDLFLFVWRKRMFEEPRIRRLIRLANYAERHCSNHSICHAIYHSMARICRQSGILATRERAREYLKKLPLLSYARELLAPEIFEGEEREQQVKWLIFRTADLCDCALRRLIDEDTPPDVCVDLNRRAATIYETLLSDSYGGFWDIPLLINYSTMVKHLLVLGRRDEADRIMERFFTVLDRHALPPDQRPTAELVSETHPYGYTEPEVSGEELVRRMLGENVFAPYRERLQSLYSQLYEKR